jgi:hypothetical protein
MGIGALGFALWSLYDGAIKYPHAQERALAFEQLYDENRADDWAVYASERGWSAAIPEQSKTEDAYKASIFMQYAQFVVAGLVGIWLISLPIRARGRWIEANDTGITSSWGQSLKFEDVTNLEKRQWRGKGIAKVAYMENGRKRRFVIDDYKFDRHNTDAILYELEQRIDPELITGGPPDPPPGEEDAVEGEYSDEALVHDQHEGSSPNRG